MTEAVGPMRKAPLRRSPMRYAVRIGDRGLQAIDDTKCALSAIRMMVGTMPDMHVISSDDFACLLNFLVEGIEEGMEKQRSELNKAQSECDEFLTELQRLHVRSLEPYEGRRLQILRDQMQDRHYPQYLAAAIAKAEAEAADLEKSKAEVEALLREGAA